MEEMIKIYNRQGDTVGEFKIEDRWIELEKGEQAVHDVVVEFLAAIRAGTASTKTRAEVRGSGSKPYRQKGTGRARAGLLRSPNRVGGGVTFGPKPRIYYKKINKKVKKLALKRVFSEKIKENAVSIVDNMDFENHKTKNTVKMLKNLNLDNRKTLLVVKDYNEDTILSTNNIPNVLLIDANCLNAYQLLYYDKILFEEDAIKKFVERL